MTSLSVDGADVLVIYGDQGQTAELAFTVGANAQVKPTGVSVKTRITEVSITLIVLRYHSKRVPGLNDCQHHHSLGRCLGSNREFERPDHRHYRVVSIRKNLLAALYRRQWHI